jgi:hypothetical protein
MYVAMQSANKYWLSVLAATFAVASLFGVPDNWPPKLYFRAISWTAVTISLLGLLCSRYSVCSRWHESRKKKPMTILLVAATGALIAVGLFFLLPTDPPAIAQAPSGKGEPKAPTNASDVHAALPNVDLAYRELVAEVVRAVEPNSKITVGGKMAGPNGSTAVDIQILSLEAKPRLTLIEVVDQQDGKPVGIELVDRAENKRREIGVDVGLICSNSGFDAAAIRKAKLLGVGLISVVKRGDSRAKALIEEEIFLRRVKVKDLKFRFAGASPEDGQILRSLKDMQRLSLHGAYLSDWLAIRSSNAVSHYLDLDSDNALKGGWLQDRLRFKQPTVVSAEGHKIQLVGMAYTVRLDVEWLVQTVRLDATAAVYDYVRGQLKLGRSPNGSVYIVDPIDFQKAIPTDPPPRGIGMKFGFQPKDVSFSLVHIDGAVPPLVPSALREAFNKIEQEILPEDLSVNIKESDDALKGWPSFDLPKSTSEN